jgi:type IV pilus assembly protein PilB
MKRMGEILIEQGILMPHQLEAALEKQKTEPGKLLGQILADLRFVTEDDILSALAAQFRIPYLDVSGLMPAKSLSHILNKEFAMKNKCLPVSKNEDVLSVAVCDPTNERVIQDMKTACGLEIRLFVAHTAHIEEAIKRCYGDA